MKRKNVVFFSLFVFGLLFFARVDAHAYSVKRSSLQTQHNKRAKEVAALLKAYGDFIDSVGMYGDEIVFNIRGTYIYYKEGKMLSEEELSRHKEYDSIFYFYQIGPIQELPAPTKYPKNRSNAFLDALIGKTDKEIRASCEWLDFLGRRAFVHQICVEPLRRVDQELREYAHSSKEVRSFVENLKLIYSFKRRRVAGTDNMSYHAYGLAIDLIPRIYRGKQVYWRWSSPYFPDWSTIPLSERWHPPFEVIRAFEENGFLWGGKWYHFDTVHFEYRPEILYFSESSFQ